MQGFKTLIFHPNLEDVAVSSGGKLVGEIYIDQPFRAPAEFVNMTSPAGHSELNTVPVVFLAAGEGLPEGFIQSLPQGPKEFFATQENLRKKLF